MTFQLRAFPYSCAKNRTFGVPPRVPVCSRMKINGAARREGPFPSYHNSMPPSV